MFMAWFGFIVSLATIVIVARKNLALALAGGAVVLGLFTMPILEVTHQILRTVSDFSIIWLALAMGMIPILGGIMIENGQIESLVQNVRIKKRYLLAFAAAGMGLLPMPGGALLSAPILEQVGPNVPNDIKAAVNNWFRHLFILIYPLSSALIVAAKIAELDVYVAILYLLPIGLIAALLGYILFLRNIHGTTKYHKPFSWRGLIVPLTVILSAPVIDFSLKRIFSIGTFATLTGVATGLILAIILGEKRVDIAGVVSKTRPWNFALIIPGMFLYLYIFQESNARDIIATIPLPPLILALTGGFILAVATGRVQLPASIVLPVYLATGEPMTPFIFAMIYVATFFGYIGSPVHPCLIVSCEYFHVSVTRMVRNLAVPTLVIILLVLIAAWITLL
ncbi:MAG: hypothetical protein DRP47_11745 [Candidatus Zixiibacteriota bacterium]|nr:MAG: hypothetical protein DRP47_11745 [candidate division Zixibacteria bacterium]